MNLKERIQSDLKEALKKKDALKCSVLRMLLAVIHNVEIQKKKKEEGLEESEIIEIVSGEVKKRKEAIREYKKGGREELAEKEKKEVEILMEYLPEQIGEDEIKKLVQEAIAKTGATSPAGIGQVMGVLMPKLKGKAEGSVVSKIIQEELSKK